MTRLPDVSDSKINNAGAMDALAKGDEMKSFVPDELWDERMRLMSAQPIEAIDAWTKAAKMVSELKIQLATRDALIERLVDCGDALADLYDSEMYPETAIESRSWRALVAEWKASEDGGGM